MLKSKLSELLWSEYSYFRRKFYKKVVLYFGRDWLASPACKWRELWETFWRRDWVAAINIIAEERAAIKRVWEVCCICIEFVFVFMCCICICICIYGIEWRPSCLRSVLLSRELGALQFSRTQDKTRHNTLLVFLTDLKCPQFSQLGES